MFKNGMTRRHFLGHVAGASAMAVPAIEFVRNLQANAQTLRQQNKSVIILWMSGGPATIDIWDLKPGRPTGGEFREMNTSVSGIKISEHMPKVAEQMRHLAIVRSLTTTEGDHARGRSLMHTSYTPNPALAFPSLGAIAAHEIPKLAGYHDISLPNYISVGGNADGPGFLGMAYAPFSVQNPGSAARKHSSSAKRRHRRRGGRTHPASPTPVLHARRPVHRHPRSPPRR